MAKRNSIKNKNKTAIFFLGVCAGMLLFWVPFEHPFKPFTFESSPWKQTASLLQGSFPIPTTTPIIEHKGYAVAYDGRTRNAAWVYHRLTPDSLNKAIQRDQCTFQQDPAIPKQISAGLKDYEGSGFDRGHLVPATDCAASLETMQESFYLSNISPQVPEFNRGYWKHLETQMRALLKQFPIVHIFTGPLYLPAKSSNQKRYVKYEVLGKHDVAVPTHFFALVFAEKSPSELVASGYILPNKAIASEIPLKKFEASIEEIEKASGIVFSKPMEIR